MTLFPCCGFCSGRQNLLQCAGCKVIQYCSKDHQVAHRPAHKRDCNSVMKCRGHCAQEERALRDHPGDWMMDPDPFTNSVGHFWEIVDTRDYMKARYALAEATMKANTFLGIETALDHLTDMLRLCRRDNMGLRDIVPSLMIRLNEDQKCYDFIKWWQTVGQDSNYDWEDMSLPYQNTKDADAFEPVTFINARSHSLSHAVSMTLLKIKLLVDIEGLQHAAALAAETPQEMVDHIKQYIPKSTIVLSNKTIMNGTAADYAELFKKLKQQIENLYKDVHTTNRYFWPALLSPDSHLGARPESYVTGSVEEMQLLLQHSYHAWKETPGALEVIRAKAAPLILPAAPQ